MKKYHKNNVQSLFEKENTLSNLSAMGNPLEELVKVIDFESFRPQIEAVFEKQQRKSNAGRRPFDPVMMFKVLFLQRLYGLSDHQTQYQITDRNSFRVFLGICNVDDVPDEKTIWKYREIFTENNKFDEIFECYLNELKDKGLELNEGKIIDASFVIVPRSRNTREENAEIKKGNGKNLWNGENKKKHKDVDARWTKKNNENFFGYKNHVKVDKKTKLVEKYDITSANVHDSQVATSLISESDKGQQVWMDAGYTGLDDDMRELEVVPVICEKGFRNHPLTEEQRESNRQKSKVRSRVEHVFGFMERAMYGLIFRGIGLVRARANVALTNLVYNVCRMVQIVKYHPEFLECKTK